MNTVRKVCTKYGTDLECSTLTWKVNSLFFISTSFLHEVYIHQFSSLASSQPSPQGTSRVCLLQVPSLAGRRVVHLPSGINRACVLQHPCYLSWQWPRLWPKLQLNSWTSIKRQTPVNWIQMRFVWLVWLFKVSSNSWKYVFFSESLSTCSKYGIPSP